jgi:alkanesulfonate monooxygenase SsuD/methylene tetrahydromethanopterin reductase-like flavin-dependent oxidoreductase (luciferase family)
VSISLSFGLVTTNQDWLTDELEALDASGFDALYVVDHPAFPTPDPWTWLAFAAARTSRVRLGTHVTGAPFHHPTTLAKQVATVDRLSHGRAVLGIGAAYEHADFEPYGFPMLPFRERLAALEETLQILDSLWTREKTRFSGTHYTLQGDASFEPKPVQKPRPPILLGLNRHGEALRIAVDHTDGINTWQLGANQVAALRPEVERACEQASRDPGSFQLTSDLLLARGANRAGAERLASMLRDTARSWGRSHSVTQWDADGILYGDADGVAEQALRFAEIGVSELGVAIHHVDELHWFSEHVIAPLKSELARAASTH